MGSSYGGKPIFLKIYFVYFISKEESFNVKIHCGLFNPMFNAISVEYFEHSILQPILLRAGFSGVNFLYFNVTINRNE